MLGTNVSHFLAGLFVGPVAHSGATAPWVDGHTFIVQGEGEARLVTPGELAAKAASEANRASAYAATRTPGAWVARVSNEAKENTSVVIGVASVDNGLVSQGRYGISFVIEEELAGPAVPDSVLIIQPTDALRPTAHGMPVLLGSRFMLAISPSVTTPDAWDLLVDYETLVFGWAIERSSGEFHSSDGVHGISRFDLVSISLRGD